MKNITLLSILFAVVIAFAGCKKKEETTPLTKVKMQYNASLIKQSYKPGERFQLDVTVTNGGSGLIDTYEFFRTYDRTGKSRSVPPDFKQTVTLNPAAKSFTHTIDYVVENKPAGTSIKFFFDYGSNGLFSQTEDYIEIFVQP
ncbi:MAG: hypothetical protein MUC49_21435 [Raineya sp.]|jgi:hypothetical protein|nr:hypothetical protein [Raineya sp.]